MPRSPATEYMVKRRHFMLMTLLAAQLPGSLMAAPPGALVVPELEGTAPDGRPLSLAQLRGQVVLVFYWSTGCAVCRDKMRELRANLTGWQGQPFTLLGVNMDTNQKDFLDYEGFVRQTVPNAQRFTSLWSGASDFRDTMGRPDQLPSGCLMDKNGQLVERYRGRIPVEAWNRIADLL